MGSLRNLVIVRAGDRSLHRQWLAGPEAPNFDLIVSYFGDDPLRFRWPNEARVDQKGGKWNGLAALFAARPELLRRYDYVWLPDDDIAADTITINGIFASMPRYGLSLAQPALTLGSHYTYLSYLCCRSFALRFADSIEVMVPCLSAELLRRVLPLIENSPSGWGLDGVWTRLAPDNRRTSAILDLWQVEHTRPLGQTLYAAMAKDGLSAWDDLTELRRRIGRRRPYPMIYEAIDHQGRSWKSKRSIGMRMAADYFSKRKQITKYHASKNTIYEVLRRQLYHKIDLEILDLSNNSGAI